MNLAPWEADYLWVAREEVPGGTGGIPRSLACKRLSCSEGRGPACFKDLPPLVVSPDFTGGLGLLARGPGCVGALFQRPQTCLEVSGFTANGGHEEHSTGTVLT